MRFFDRFKREDPLDDEIACVLHNMAYQGPDSTKEYNELLTQLERLYALKGKTNARRRVSPDTLAIIIGNLLGIGIVVGYEQTHAMGSKAINMLQPARFKS